MELQATHGDGESGLATENDQHGKKLLHAASTSARAAGGGEPFVGAVLVEAVLASARGVIASPAAQLVGPQPTIIE